MVEPEQDTMDFEAQFKTKRATLTIDEAAEILGISRSAAYRAADTGEIPTIQIGRRRLVPRARLEELLRGS